jgi:hypothetical protein
VMRLLSGTWPLICSAISRFTDVLGRLACGMIPASARQYLNGLLQSPGSDSVRSPTSALIVVRRSAGPTFSLAVNVKVLHWATAEGKSEHLSLLLLTKTDNNVCKYLLPNFQ